jgi:hypothetical protein
MIWFKASGGGGHHDLHYDGSYTRHVVPADAVQNRLRNTQKVFQRIWRKRQKNIAGRILLIFIKIF